MIKQYYTPNCPECMGQTDSESINNAVKLAVQTGSNKVVIPRINERTGAAEWIIDKAIILPNDIQIVLDNCYLKQAEGCFDNMFRNENFYNEDIRCKPEGEQRNIHITGVGNAVMDGWIHNGHTESTSEKDGMPHIMVNNLILMHNVDQFSITGITMKNQRWWAIHLIFCSHGLLENITFDAKGDYPNQDGIDVRAGCHHLTIRDIYGVCGDDVVALTGFMGFFLLRKYSVEGKSHDIHHVYINNVMACSTEYATVALRNMDGIKLYDVTIDGVTDISDGVTCKPNTMVRIGQKAWARVRISEIGETSRILIKNIHVNHGMAVMLNQTLADTVISDIFCGPEAECAISTSPRSRWFKPGAIMRNVTIDGVYCAAENTSQVPLIELLKGENHEVWESEITKSLVEVPEYLENVVIRNVSTAKKGPIFFSEYEDGYVLEK